MRLLKTYVIFFEKMEQNKYRIVKFMNICRKIMNLLISVPCRGGLNDGRIRQLFHHFLFLLDKPEITSEKLEFIDFLQKI